jgi:hypothetical protein
MNEALSIENRSLESKCSNELSKKRKETHHH